MSGVFIIDTLDDDLSVAAQSDIVQIEVGSEPVCGVAVASVFPLDDDDDDEDDIDVQVFVPGPPGPPLVDVDTRALPALVTGAIAAPKYRRQRSFLVGNAGPVFNPVIANPSDNGAWELFLFFTDDTNTVTFENQANLLLSGQFIGRNGSLLYLQWDGSSQYVEGGRNEI